MNKNIRVLALLLAICLGALTACSSSSNVDEPDFNEQITQHIHEFGEWEVVDEPTLTEKGTKIRYCSCGESQTGSIAKLKPENDDTITTEGDNTTENATTDAPNTEDRTTEEPTAETPTDETPTEEPTDDVTPEKTAIAKRTHFTDSLDTNGPLTENCLPSTGTPKVLVVPVNLKSSNATKSMLKNIEIAFNGTTEETGWYSVAEYYHVSSYGKLDIEFEVLDEWFTPSKSKSYYGSYDDGDYYGSTLILDEFLKAYDKEIDFSQYDSNDDGYIDSIWLIYNCPVDYDGDSDYWAYVYWTPSEIEVDGVYACYYGFAGTDFMFEDADSVVYPVENIKVDAHTYIHETGHLLGLDDYYDYNENVGVTGGFYWADMMDGNIGDHSSINKLLLGWIDPIVVSGTGTIEIDLNSFAKTGDAILISNHNITSIYDEYFLIEFYTSDLLNTNDMPIFNTNDDDVIGIRILHINANICYDDNGEVIFNNDNGYSTGFLYDNSDEDRLFVDTLYCELLDEYATDDILFTPTSESFWSKYSDYQYHDETAINFDITVNSMNSDFASITVTIK